MVEDEQDPLFDDLQVQLYALRWEKLIHVVLHMSLQGAFVVTKQSPVFSAVHPFYNSPPIPLLTADEQFPCYFPPLFATYVVASNGDRAASLA